MQPMINPIIAPGVPNHQAPILVQPIMQTTNSTIILPYWLKACLDIDIEYE